jgi:ribosomal protein S18 acetylase RimI-like enzyme
MLGESSHCEIRPGALADAPALSELFRSSWSNAYQGIIPHMHLDGLIRRRTAEWWGTAIKSGSELLVLQVSDVVAGYATLGPARVRGECEGEIYEIYILPTYQGLGFGERLFEACRHHLDGRQLCGLIVWALADNLAASDFYWRRGGRPVGVGFERFGRARLKKVAFAWD